MNCGGNHKVPVAGVTRVLVHAQDVWVLKVACGRCASLLAQKPGVTVRSL